MRGLLGKKIGMTHIFLDNGDEIPVTVVKADPSYVVQKKTVDTDGYNAIQIGFDVAPQRKLTKPEVGHIESAKKKSGKEIPFLRKLVELKLSDNEVEKYNVGDELTVEVFKEGEIVDVVATSKGRGFQGGVKRHGFGRKPETHGTKGVRLLGSLGAATGISKIMKGKKMPGQMGNARTTVHNLKIMKIDSENSLILIKGALPGYNGSTVLIKEPSRFRGKK
jgi:large subunit ribosomal protein L3